MDIENSNNNQMTIDNKITLAVFVFSVFITAIALYQSFSESKAMSLYNQMVEVSMDNKEIRLQNTLVAGLEKLQASDDSKQCNTFASVTSHDVKNLKEHFLIIDKRMDKSNGPLGGKVRYKKDSNGVATLYVKLKQS